MVTLARRAEIAEEDAERIAGRHNRMVELLQLVLAELDIKMTGDFGSDETLTVEDARSGRILASDVKAKEAYHAALHHRLDAIGDKS